MNETKILVVDDDEEVLNLIKTQLKSAGTVITAKSAEEAEKVLEDHNFAVAVSDYKMGAKTGIDLLTEIAKKQPNCQRIMITAFSDLANLEDTINKARLNFFMTKPWDTRDLELNVKNAITQHLTLTENEELRKMAWTDSLTEVPNNRYFWERLDSELARAKRYGRSLSLIMLDVDDFKKYNDEHGHQEGDRVLKTVAQHLNNSLRNMDTLARYGGEEFCIILPETNSKIAHTIATRLLKAIKKETQISLSLGVAEFPTHADNSKDLVHCADLALLKAKEQGKSQALVYKK